MKISGLAGVLETLKALPPEIVSKKGGPVKLSLAKGARLLRDEAIKNLRATANPDIETQLLVDNVIATRGKAPAGGKGERYLVRVKRKTYPRNDKEAVTTHKTGQIKEYGSVNQAAEPWLRPAVQNKGPEVVTVITDDLIRRIDRTVKKIAKQNTGKK